jgi:predicted metal-dependent hydrolase
MNTPLPTEFWQGVEQFNQGHFYGCHDTLETLWMQAVEPERTLYQGILQLAVSLYHLSNHNWRGAVTLMGEGLYRLRTYPAEYAGLDLEHLQTEMTDLLTTLQTIGETGIRQLIWQDEVNGQENPDQDEKIVKSRPIIQKVSVA